MINIIYNYLHVVAITSAVFIYIIKGEYNDGYS